jgi:cytochrome c
MKATFIGIALLAEMFSTTVASVQSSPPTSPKAQEIEALVNKAAVLIDAKGKASFSEFRIKGTEWFHGDTYLFADDLKGDVLLNPAFPACEGPTSGGRRTPTGSSFTTRSFGQMKPRAPDGLTICFKPGQTQPSQKL